MGGAALVMLLLAAAFGISACGGGGGSGGGLGGITGTPAGTYSMLVNGSTPAGSATLQNPVDVTLVVQ
jgi:hypothetical protein